MANHRPKSLSELNNVYDKAMRAERAIKEGSSLLSVPETKETPQSENIFKQLESKAAQAEKNQVFDPDITNIANDFLKRYAQPEKPKAPAKEIKRPAPSIQSVYRSALKPKQEEKQDVSLNMNEDSSVRFNAPAVPLHKPAPTIPEAQPAPSFAETAEEAAPEVISPVPPVSPEVPVVTAPQTVVTDNQNTASDIPADTSAPAIAQVTPAKPAAPRPVHKAPSRVRITSTERNELMEEYLRVMSDDDDDEAYKKPKFSFFKKKKKYEEEFDEEPMADLYEELPEEDEAYEEVPTVPFDNSQVKYTDEYSDAPSNDEATVSQEQMNIYDYIEADFDYDDEYSEDDEEALLDVSFADDVKMQEESPADDSLDITEEIPSEEVAEETESEAEDACEEVIEEAPEAVTEEEKEEKEETNPADDTDGIPDAQENQSAEEYTEAVIIPEEEEAEPAPQESPTADMVFEDIFSVSDESKRSHTGGNWEEVFGESIVPATEAVNEEYSEYTPDADEEYVEIHEESEQSDFAEEATDESEAYEEDETDVSSPKGGFLLKLLMVLVAVVCIICSAATLLISALIDVNSGKLIADQYRVFSTSEDLTQVALDKNTLVITENIYAHIDDVYVFVNEDDGGYEFGKVTASIPSLTGDYLYLTVSDSGTKAINRDKSMGVVIATYAGIGGLLAAICEYYIFIAGAFILLAIAMIVCLVVFSKKRGNGDDTKEDAQADRHIPDDSDTDYTDNDADTDIGDEEESEYYSDYDTDGIEQGLFSDI